MEVTFTQFRNSSYLGFQPDLAAAGARAGGGVVTVAAVMEPSAPSPPSSDDLPLPPPPPEHPTHIPKQGSSTCYFVTLNVST